MHEFALAEAVVKTALRSAEEGGLRRITRIVVSVGDLQGIDPELFEFSLTRVLPESDPRLAGVDFLVQHEEARFTCRACAHCFGRRSGHESGEASEAIHFIPELSHAWVRCPECGSPDFEITAGRGVTLQRIEGSEAEPGAG